MKQKCYKKLTVKYIFKNINLVMPYFLNNHHHPYKTMTTSNICVSCKSFALFVLTIKVYNRGFLLNIKKQHCIFDKKTFIKKYNFVKN